MLREATKALNQGKHSDVRRIVSEIPDVVTEVDQEGRTLLLNACLPIFAKMDVQTIEAIAASPRCRLDHTDRNGMTALHCIAASHTIDNPQPAAQAAEHLIRRGATVDARDSHGNTPLFRAVFNWRDELDTALIDCLLAAGADMNAANNAKTSPLALAKNIAGHEKLVSHLSAKNGAPSHGAGG